METQAHTPSPVPPHIFKLWGVCAVVIGALALIVVLVQIFGPSTSPEPSVATSIGEIAGEIKRSAWRSFFGLAQPEPEVVPTTLKDWLPLAGPALGIVAVLLSLVSGLKHENWRLPAYGAGLGASAIVFYTLWWVALLVLGAMILVAIIENIGDIFSF